MLSVISGNSSQRMSLKEITDLIGVRHDKACLKLLSMAEEPEFGTVSISDIVYNEKGQTIKTYMLDRRQSIAVASRLNTALLMRVIDRWQELESKNESFSIPKTFADALRLAADQQEIIQNQAAKIEQQKPAVEFVGRYVESTGNKGFREVCKLLEANESEFRLFLAENKIMYRLGGDWTAYQNHIDAGRFAVKTGVAKHNDHSYLAAKFTPKGVEWISNLWRKHVYNHQCEITPQ